jgi:hypothetical protein
MKPIMHCGQNKKLLNDKAAGTYNYHGFLFR